MGNCDCSMVDKTWRLLQSAVLPFVYFFLLALGCIYTFTERENASVKTSWIYVMTFNWIFVAIITYMFIRSLINMCRGSTSTDAETAKSMMRETCWLLGLVTASSFVTGLVWWVHAEDYTNDTWQREVAHHCWPLAIAGTLVTPFVGYSIANSMSA